MMESRMQRRVACPVWRALGGCVLISCWYESQPQAVTAEYPKGYDRTYLTVLGRIGQAGDKEQEPV